MTTNNGRERMDVRPVINVVKSDDKGEVAFNLAFFKIEQGG